MTYEDMRLEFNRPLFKKLLRDNLGDKCVNCNSDYKVEYHHIVPLALGGTNRLSNIVPLCYQCHRAAHNGRHITQYAKKSKNTGRPNKTSYEDAEPILDKWVMCMIGTAECMELLGYNKGSHLADRPLFKQFCKNYKISKCRNNVDIIRHKNGGEIPQDGRVLGYTEYENGGKMTIFEGWSTIYEPCEEEE